MSVKRNDLTQFLNELLSPHLFNDYGPNGLQIEGNDNIESVAFAVSATKDSISQAISHKADTLIVHHGLFWKFHGTRTLTNTFGKRVIPLVQANMNLYGYHLPLDAHIKIGNAAQIAKRLQLTNIETFGEYKKSPLGVKGSFVNAITGKKLKAELNKILDHTILHACEDENTNISSIGIITGGANSQWIDAANDGLDAYLTGEMSEHDWHESSEAGIHMFAGGHNATEQFGIQALKQSLEKKFPNINTIFLSSENPA